MSTQDFLARSAFNDLEASIELALSQTEGFRDEAENFADLARRGIRLVGVVANLSSFPANPEDGDAVFVESETQIYFWDATSSTWKNSQIVGSAIWGNVQGTLSDQTDLQTALDGKADESLTDKINFIERTTVSGGGSIEIETSGSGAGYAGFLIVTSANSGSALTATYKTFSVMGRGSNFSSFEIHSMNGSSGSMPFSISSDTAGFVKITNDSVNSTRIEARYYGGGAV